MANKGFMPSFMKCLKQKRKKSKSKLLIETKVQKDQRHKMENKALYLLQLWADTFMMEQD